MNIYGEMLSKIDYSTYSLDDRKELVNNLVGTEFVNGKEFLSDFWIDTFEQTKDKNTGIDTSIIKTNLTQNSPLYEDTAICKTLEVLGSYLTDYIGHGTHVAGIIASDDCYGKAIGIAPDVELMIYKVLGKDGTASYETIATSIYASIQQGAEVINLSLGGKEPAPQIREAIKSAINMQVSVICAGGNDGDGTEDTIELLFPGCYEECIEVGSISADFKPSVFSNSNQFIDCVALGENIVSPYPNERVKVLSGTSQAVPLVTGAIALLKEWGQKEYGRRLTEVEIYSILIKNTKSIPNIGRNLQGHGYVYLEPFISF